LKSEECDVSGLASEGVGEESPAPVVVEQPVPLPTAASVSLVGIFLIMLIAALYLARALVLPLVLALLFTLTAAPLVRWLARRGIPPPISSALLVAALAVVALTGLTLLRAPISDMVSHVPEMAQTLRDRFDELRKPFVMLSEVSRAVTAPPDD